MKAFSAYSLNVVVPAMDKQCPMTVQSNTLQLNVSGGVDSCSGSRLFITSDFERAYSLNVVVPAMDKQCPMTVQSNTLQLNVSGSVDSCSGSRLFITSDFERGK